MAYSGMNKSALVGEHVLYMALQERSANRWQGPPRTAGNGLFSKWYHKYFLYRQGCLYPFENFFSFLSTQTYSQSPSQKIPTSLVSSSMCSSGPIEVSRWKSQMIRSWSDTPSRPFKHVVSLVLASLCYFKRVMEEWKIEIQWKFRTHHRLYHVVISWFLRASQDTQQPRYIWLPWDWHRQTERPDNK